MDELNWKKLSHLSYVSSGFWATLGIIIEPGQDPMIAGSPVKVFISLLSAMASMISSSFIISLWYGVRYLQKRKETEVALERTLRGQGGECIVAPQAESVQYLRSSPTTWMLRMVPVVVTLIWLAVFVVSVSWSPLP